MTEVRPGKTENKEVLTEQKVSRGHALIETGGLNSN